jgi:hypothetical protein
MNKSCLGLMVVIIGMFSSNLFAQDENSSYFQFKDFPTSQNPQPFYFSQFAPAHDKPVQIRSKKP